MSSSTPTPLIVLCTGANQGLGYGIIHICAARRPTDTYILCSRRLEAGHEAVRKLRDAGVTAKLDVIQLDVTDDAQIEKGVRFVEERYGRLDVLINNAGIVRAVPPAGSPLSAIRKAYTEVLDVNLTSVAVVTAAFLPLLRRSAGDPKVISISSGLGSITNTFVRKMARAPAYGASKVGMNGLMAHLQVAENDLAAAGAGNEGKRVRFYVCAPGVTRTSFTRYTVGKEPEEGAEVVYRLLADEEGTYEGGTYWEFEEGEMRQVPW